ncbi:MAG: CRTAC1 family protein [Acidobacteria bacterium]|nr:MAG: CRTAC1 family protein [Acidobacteriota bacterium]
MTRAVVAPLGVLMLAAAMTRAASPPVLFRDITAEAGIAFQHHAAPEKKYIVESMAGGVALFDFDRDGLTDIYFVDSLTVDTANSPMAARSALYRNLGHGKFEDVTDRSGIGHPGWGMGVCAADVDDDGWDDLYVTALGRNRLYRNNHDGTFTDIAERAGVAGGGWSTGCGFADYDRDGRLDLFVSRYVKIDLDHLPQFGKDKTCEYRGIAVQCGPRGLAGESDFLFHNDGNGRFSEVAARAGVSDPNGYFGLGVAWFDYNDDGWPDLYVANDSTANFLYRNNGDGTFREIAFPAGVAVSEDGAEQGSMGVALGDYLNAGRLSLFVTNFSEEYNALYRHDGDHFTDVSFSSKTAAPSLPLVGWGTAFVDYDNDGLLDLMAVNGHVYPQLDKVRLGASAGYRQRKLLYHNRGNGTFDEVAAQFGPVMTDARVGRGLAAGDLDNDGGIDVVVNNLDGSPEVLHNELLDRGNWLLVKLTGPRGNTDAIGAVVKARTGAVTRTRVVQSGTSYLSQHDMRAHFGLGSASQVDSLEVRWPDGTTSKMVNVKANQIVAIKR